MADIRIESVPERNLRQGASPLLTAQRAGLGNQLVEPAPVTPVPQGLEARAADTSAIQRGQMAEAQGIASVVGAAANVGLAYVDRKNALELAEEDTKLQKLQQEARLKYKEIRDETDRLANAEGWNTSQMEDHFNRTYQSWVEANFSPDNFNQRRAKEAATKAIAQLSTSAQLQYDEQVVFPTRVTQTKKLAMEAINAMVAGYADNTDPTKQQELYAKVTEFLAQPQFVIFGAQGRQQLLDSVLANGDMAVAMNIMNNAPSRAAELTQSLGGVNAGTLQATAERINAETLALYKNPDILKFIPADKRDELLRAHLQSNQNAIKGLAEQQEKALKARDEAIKEQGNAAYYDIQRKIDTGEFGIADWTRLTPDAVGGVENHHRLWEKVWAADKVKREAGDALAQAEYFARNNLPVAGQKPANATFDYLLKNRPGLQGKTAETMSLQDYQTLIPDLARLDKVPEQIKGVAFVLLNGNNPDDPATAQRFEQGRALIKTLEAANSGFIDQLDDSTKAMYFALENGDTPKQAIERMQNVGRLTPELQAIRKSAFGRFESEINNPDKRDKALKPLLEKVDVNAATDHVQARYRNRVRDYVNEGYDVDTATKLAASDVAKTTATTEFALPGKKVASVYSPEKIFGQDAKTIRVAVNEDLKVLGVDLKGQDFVLEPSRFRAPNGQPAFEIRLVDKDGLVSPTTLENPRAKGKAVLWTFSPESLPGYRQQEQTKLDTLIEEGVYRYRLAKAQTQQTQVDAANAYLNPEFVTQTSAAVARPPMDGSWQLSRIDPDTMREAASEDAAVDTTGLMTPEEGVSRERRSRRSVAVTQEELRYGIEYANNVLATQSRPATVVAKNVDVVSPLLPQKPVSEKGKKLVSFNYDHPELDAAAIQTEDRYGLPRGTLLALKNYGERSNPDAVSPKGAQGLMQFMPQTWDSYGRGENPFDPLASLDASARYMKDLIQMYNGNVIAAAAHYNGGTAQGRLVARGLQPSFTETRKYVERYKLGLERYQAPMQVAAR